jgi:hypothetical protein
MFDQMMSLLFLAPVAPVDTWSTMANSVNLSSAMHVRMEVSGRRTPGCDGQGLAVPPARGGAIRFEERGVRYAGTLTPSGHLMLRSDAPRPLILNGNMASGGKWSRGTDGTCVGIWQLVR